jgi:hypothetical protein
MVEILALRDASGVDCPGSGLTPHGSKFSCVHAVRSLARPSCSSQNIPRGTGSEIGRRTNAARSIWLVERGPTCRTSHVKESHVSNTLPFVHRLCRPLSASRKLLSNAATPSDSCILCDGQYNRPICWRYTGKVQYFNLLILLEVALTTIVQASRFTKSHQWIQRTWYKSPWHRAILEIARSNLGDPLVRLAAADVYQRWACACLCVTPAAHSRPHLKVPLYPRLLRRHCSLADVDTCRAVTWSTSKTPHAR